MVSTTFNTDVASSKEILAHLTNIPVNSRISLEDASILAKNVFGASTVFLINEDFFMPPKYVFHCRQIVVGDAGWSVNRELIGQNTCSYDEEDEMLG